MTTGKVGPAAWKSGAGGGRWVLGIRKIAAQRSRGTTRAAAGEERQTACGHLALRRGVATKQARARGEGGNAGTGVADPEK